MFLHFGPGAANVSSLFLGILLFFWVLVVLWLPRRCDLGLRFFPPRSRRMFFRMFLSRQDAKHLEKRFRCCILVVLRAFRGAL